MQRPINFSNTITGLNIFQEFVLESYNLHKRFFKNLLNIFVILFNDLVFLLKKPIISIFIFKKTC